MNNRRSFLGAILVAASAPAFVQASSLMKIFVPPTSVWVPSTFLTSVDGDFTIEAWFYLDSNGRIQSICHRLLK